MNPYDLINMIEIPVQPFSQAKKLGNVGTIWWVNGSEDPKLEYSGSWLLNFYDNQNQNIHNVVLGVDKNNKPEIIGKVKNYLIVTV